MLELPEAAREARLSTLDVTIQRRQRELLAADAVAGSNFFEKIIEKDIDSERETCMPDVNFPDGRLEIDGYRILARLPAGGMGEVYKAYEISTKRDVAIKIVKPGFDTNEMIARFENEYLLLGRMHHPGIPALYSAKNEEGKLHYFVMEFFPGTPITEFADQEMLTIPQRLDLFAQTCDAIAHAHASGVIHRDIKPGNVHAFMSEGQPRVKVFDFGIAKTTYGRSPADRFFNTELGDRIGSPGAMSPEQLAGSMDVDTRSDIHSLGGLLYELLCGMKPSDSNPERPSRRLKSASGGLAHDIASKRGVSLRKLSRLLKSNYLESIPMMALRTERGRRYQSAKEFENDIQGYLNNGWLRAPEDSFFYRWRRRLRHNVPAFALSAAIFLLISLGIGAYLHLTREIDKYSESLTGIPVLKRDFGRFNLVKPEGKAKVAWSSDGHTVASATIHFEKPFTRPPTINVLVCSANYDDYPKIPVPRYTIDAWEPKQSATEFTLTVKFLNAYPQDKITGFFIYWTAIGE